MSKLVRLITKATNGNVYMHTIKGRPAMYYNDEQIVYVNQWNRVSFEEMFVESLETIKKQQEASHQYRDKKGWNDNLADDYGYIRIKLS